VLHRPSAFRDLVSGRARGVGPTLLRSLLGLVEPCYAAAVAWRNRRYDRDPERVTRVGVPVISVGNLTLGGTGKTPLVAWIAAWLRARGIRVMLISRGYGRPTPHPDGPAPANDEALELAQKLPDVPHLQNPDRVAAARQAIAEHAAEVLLLDDAFQHRRIARDLDIVLLDALEPFGFDHVFPRGTLREPVAGLRRAQIVVLSRADQISPAQRAAIRATVARLTPQAHWAEAVHAPQVLRSAAGQSQPLAALAGRRVAAFCAIGNPAGFRHTLCACGVQTVELREFPDHHRYTAADVAELSRWADQLSVDAVLCTHKDLVKLNALQLGPRPLWAVEIGVQFLTGQTEFEEQLSGVLPKSR